MEQKDVNAFIKHLEKIKKTKKNWEDIRYTVVSDYGYTNTIRLGQMRVSGNDVLLVFSDYYKRSLKKDYNRIITKPAIASDDIWFGSDPELFFTDENGSVIPSAHVLKSDVVTNELTYGFTGEIATDGFQFELHPTKSHCRQLSGAAIRHCLRTAKSVLTDGIKISFKIAHEIDDSIWESVGEDIKRFGCNPSVNTYGEGAVTGDGLDCKFRAGGGHIHIGIDKEIKRKHKTLVKMFDIFCGNTLVLIDRDEANIKRREKYGRAGEYRLKPYGIEYRVPSNFWMRHYVLWSLASGQLANAVAMTNYGLAKDFIQNMDMDKVREAINKNDYNLALENFTKMMTVMNKYGIETGRGITKQNHEAFLRWATGKNPIGALRVGTDNASLSHWTNKNDFVKARGFERFIRNY